MIDGALLQEVAALGLVAWVAWRLIVLPALRRPRQEGGCGGCSLRRSCQGSEGGTRERLVLLPHRASIPRER